MFGQEFYPTPKPLIAKMMAKVDFSKVNSILDPSAGKGDILLALQDKFEYSYRNYEFMAIEIDPNLQSVLQGLKAVSVIDSDFLQYDVSDHFDLIMMNPPFSCGDLHLLKAIEIMHSGQIVCILNAETIRNPYTNTRYLLAKKLAELGAQIECIQDDFVDAERKTGVEIALIYINIEKSASDDLFAGAEDADNDPVIDESGSSEVVQHEEIQQRIERYNAAKKAGFELIQFHQKNGSKYCGLLHVSIVKDHETEGRIKRNQTLFANYVRLLRRKFWHDLMDSPQVADKLTAEKRSEYRMQLQQRSVMEFNLRNIQTVFMNLQNTYYKAIEDAIVDMFDEMTHEYAWTNECSANRLHFNGWKTNKSWKVNHKVILPYFKFTGWSGEWSLGYEKKQFLHDIDRVMSYFDGGNSNYESIVDAVELAFRQGQSRKILSTYFEINCFKKGTIHLKFRDEGILRRFNVFACKQKGWLPPAYGTTPVNEMNAEEREVVKEFDGKLENYTLLPSNNELLKLAA